MYNPRPPNAPFRPTNTAFASPPPRSTTPYRHPVYIRGYLRRTCRLPHSPAAGPPVWGAAALGCAFPCPVCSRRVLSPVWGADALGCVSGVRPGACQAHVRVRVRRTSGCVSGARLGARSRAPCVRGVCCRRCGARLHLGACQAHVRVRVRRTSGCVSGARKNLAHGTNSPASRAPTGLCGGRLLAGVAQ